MTYDYGSGALGDWTTYQHGETGDWASAMVGALGDSILNRGRGALATALSAVGATLATNYWSSRPTAPTVDALLAKAEELGAAGQTLPGIIVMEPGANDIFQPTVMAEQIQRVKDAHLENYGVRHILWSEAFVCRTSQTPQVQMYDMRNTGLVNNQIRAAFDDAHVIDWYRWLTYRGTSYVPLYLEDGVHPWTASGSTPYNHMNGVEFWAEIYKRKIQQFLAA